MEFPRQKNADVYVISLDAFDLNLLPTIYNTRGDKIAPLWTKSNLERRNNEYYQFEIKCKDSDESTKDRAPQIEFDTTTCYICDMNIPKPFLYEHKRSTRHRVNVQIADVAINRMKRHINSTAEERKDDEVPESAYFCPICVTVMDAKEKNAHAKSTAHRNASIVEKIFKEFLILYGTNDETNNNENISDLQLRQANDEQHPTAADIKKNDLQTVANCKEKLANPSNKLMRAIENPVKVKRKDQATVEAAEPLDIDYLALLNSRVNHAMFFKAEHAQAHDNFIEVETVDGSVVRVTEKQFHGFNKVGRKHLQCFLCKDIFKAKVMEAHKLSEIHINKLLLPLKDKHCIRQINDSHSHCVICNEITENSDLHSLCNKKHNSYLKDALVCDKLAEESVSTKAESTIVNDTDKTQKMDEILNGNEHNTLCNAREGETSAAQIKLIAKADSDNEDDSTTNSNKYLCTACNEHISIFRRGRHTTSLKHTLNSKSDKHYLMIQMDANTLVCRVCEITLTDNIHNVAIHTSGKWHNNEYKQFLIRNNIKKVTDEMFYCEVCEENVAVRNEIVHVNKPLHRTKSVAPKDVIISDAVDNAGETDMAELKDMLPLHEEAPECEEQNENETSKTTLEFHHCEVCNVKVPNYDHNLYEHLNGRAHINNLGKQTDDASDTTKEDIIIHSHMEQTEYPNILNCKVCKVQVPFKEHCIKLHVIDSKHVTNYLKLLENNFMVEKVNDVHCEICEVSVGFNSELMHIFGRKHNKKLQKHQNELAKSAVTLPLPEPNSPNTPSTSGSGDAEQQIQQMELEISAFFKPTDNPKEIMCVVCNVKVPYSEYNVRTHVNGVKHINQCTSSLTETQ